MSVSLFFFCSIPIPQAGKLSVQNQGTVLWLRRGRAETWTPVAEVSQGASYVYRCPGQFPPGWRHRCSRQVGPQVGIRATMGRAAWWDGFPQPLELSPVVTASPRALPPLSRVSGLPTATSLGPLLWARPYASSQSPWGSSIISPILHWGKLTMCGTGGGISYCDPGRSGDAKINRSLTHCVPPSLWPGSTPRNLSLFPRAPLRSLLNLFPVALQILSQMLMVPVLIC